MADGELSRRPTQINDLPSCLMIDILSRVPIETLVRSRFVCKSWFLLFSDPVFVRLHRARSPSCVVSRESRLKTDLKSYNSVGAMAGKDFEIDSKDVRKPDSKFTRANSCHGLLCLEDCDDIYVCNPILGNEIYVCNPILGEYITIPIGVNRKRMFVMTSVTDRGVVVEHVSTQSVLGFSSRSNQFKVLRLHPGVYALGPAEIYTIGDGTRRWKSIGVAPRCTTLDFPEGSLSSFLNGSIHWADDLTQQIVYFDFESEQFGSLPAPPAWRDGRWSEFVKVRVGAADGCLCIYASDDYQTGPAMIEKWAMKEYGVEESWTDIFSTHAFKFEPSYSRTDYNPSFISLQDVAESERLTVLSRTRTEDEDSPELLSHRIFQLWE